MYIVAITPLISLDQTTNNPRFSKPATNNPRLCRLATNNPRPLSLATIPHPLTPTHRLLLSLSNKVVSGSTVLE